MQALADQSQSLINSIDVTADQVLAVNRITFVTVAVPSVLSHDFATVVSHVPHDSASLKWQSCGQSSRQSFRGIVHGVDEMLCFTPYLLAQRFHVWDWDLTHLTFELFCCSRLVHFQQFHSLRDAGNSHLDVRHEFREIGIKDPVTGMDGERHDEDWVTDFDAADDSSSAPFV